MIRTPGVVITEKIHYALETLAMNACSSAITVMIKPLMTKMFCWTQTASHRPLSSRKERRHQHGMC
jgi:hypothetical protein